MYDIISAPVVDERGRLLGRITSDDVMEVLSDEAEEDMMLLVGASTEEEPFHSGDILRTSRLRLPWLLTNMAGGLVTGGLLWLFKVTMEDAIFLLAFIPVIMAMAGNVGVQSSTIMVRGFAVGQISETNLWRILYKEFRVALVIGIVCGIIVCIVAMVWHNNTLLGLVVGLSMTLAISISLADGDPGPGGFQAHECGPGHLFRPGGHHGQRHGGHPDLLFDLHDVLQTASLPKSCYISRLDFRCIKAGPALVLFPASACHTQKPGYSSCVSSPAPKQTKLIATDKSR